MYMNKPIHADAFWKSIKRFNSHVSWRYGLVLCLLLTATSMAWAFAQELTLKLKNVPFREVLRDVSKQSGYDFLYEDHYLNTSHAVTLTVVKKNILQVLPEIFKDQPFEYDVKGKMIVITPKKLSPNTLKRHAQVQQQRMVHGQVKDANLKPLEGVTVKVKGQQISSTTDENGAYQINLGAGQQLQFSMVSFETAEILVGKDLQVNVILKSITTSLDEVVVVGYGTQKRTNVIGAVSTIKAEQLANKPVTNLGEALTGEAPGLTITQASGQPGTVNATLRVRGVGTWGNSGPLVLVDGVAMNMFDVMPGDVESVTVLKDAAAASIYGSRAANGVILVTTKKGKKGKVNLNYTGNIGQQQATRVPKPASSWQYAEMFNKVTENLTGIPGTTFSQEKIDRMRNGQGDPDALEANTNWYKEMIKPAMQQMHNVSLQSGGEKTSYLASVGYTKQDGVITSTYDRYNIRLNTNSDITDWLRMGVNMSYITDDRKESISGAAGGYYYVPRSLPYYPVKFSNGDWSFLSAPHNAVRRGSYDYGVNSNRGDKLSLLIAPEVSPLEGLVFKGTFGYENKAFLNKRSTKIVGYNAFAPAGQAANTIVARNRQQDIATQERNLTAFLTANYERSFAAHDFKFMLGSSIESSKYNDIDGQRQDFPNNDFSEVSAGDINTSQAFGKSYEQSLASFFGRFNYALANKYLFEANFRHDGSSKFAAGHRWGTFPSFSAGWRIAEEGFFAGLKPHIQELKLRGSWGKLGNNRISDFLFLGVYGMGEPYIFNGSMESSYQESVMRNQIITWETATHANIGLDVAALNNRLSFSFDIYKRVTDDILLNLDASSLLGITAPIQNAGSMENKGWELSLGWNDKIGDHFRYHVNANLSDVKNKVLDLAGYKSSTTSLTTRIEGQPLDALYGWETLGIANTQADYDKYAPLMKGFIPNWNIGDIIVKDRDGDGKITAEDKTVIGNTIPRYTYGLNLGFSYKKLDFSTLLQGVGKRDAFLGRDIIEPMGIFSALEEHYNESFDPKNPSANAYYPRLLGAAQRHNWQNYSHWVQDASYLRVKNLTIGYTTSFEKAKIQKMRFSLSGQNILTFTKYRIFDPENGLNTTSFPNVAVYTLGLSVDF